MMVRYETPIGSTNETRRDRNERAGAEALHEGTAEDMDWNIPVLGRYIWDWYMQISHSEQRVGDSGAIPISWSVYRAWNDLMRPGAIAREFEILQQMDMAYCKARNEHIEYSRGK